MMARSEAGRRIAEMPTVGDRGDGEEAAAEGCEVRLLAPFIGIGGAPKSRDGPSLGGSETWPETGSASPA